MLWEDSGTKPVSKACSEQKLVCKALDHQRLYDSALLALTYWRNVVAAVLLSRQSLWRAFPMISFGYV